MTFFEIMCANILSMGITTLFFVCAAIQLLGEIPYRNRRHDYAILGSLLLFILITSLLGTVFWRSGIFSWGYNAGKILFEYLQIIGCMLFLRVMYTQGASRNTCPSGADGLRPTKYTHRASRIKCPSDCGLRPTKYTHRASRMECPSDCGLRPIRYTQRASRNTCPSGAGGLHPTKYKKPYGRCLVTAVFLYILYDAGWNLGELFAPDKFYHLEVLSERREYLFQEWVVVPFSLLLVVLLLYKTKAGKLYGQLESQRLKPGVIVFMGLYPILSDFIQEMVEINARLGGYNPMTSLIFLMIIYLIFMYAAREEMQKKQIEEQNVNLCQQQVYIENLEGLQREVRRFRHDFKNMMTGMYMQAKEGDIEAIQSYIQEMASDFDVQVGSQIRIMNQLANIRVTEVKGLFLEKLKVMQEEEIHCELEVLKPFEKTGLRSTDLCRCLGILLDNAVEEVRGKKDGQIHVMISSQDGCTTFRVKNTLYSAVDFHRLGMLGYSTKGEDRGIGLANYKRILEKYERALPLTTIQDGYFIQELKVQEP